MTVSQGIVSGSDKIEDGSVVARKIALGAVEGEHLTTAMILAIGPQSATFTVGAEASNKRLVTVQLKDVNGNNYAGQTAVMARFADSSDGLTGTDGYDSSIVATGDVFQGGGPVGPGGASAELWSNITGGTQFHSIVITESDGTFSVNLEETTGADTYYMALLLPNGKFIVSSAIVFAA